MESQDLAMNELAKHKTTPPPPPGLLNKWSWDVWQLAYTWGPLHNIFTGEKILVKSENSGKHELTIDFTIGRKLRLKFPEFFSGKRFMQYAHGWSFLCW